MPIKNNKEVHILIIGNGFDLAHGLKTAYGDFLKYCREKNGLCFELNSDYEINCETNLWIRHFINRQKQIDDTWIDLETEIYNVITHLKNSLVSVSNYPKILETYTTSKAFNIGEKIKESMKSTSFEQEVGPKYYDINIRERRKFQIYIGSYKGLVNFLYAQLREFTTMFENIQSWKY